MREKVEHKLGEEQLGFRKGRGTTDGVFALRQLVEKRLEMQGHMALVFVDLEKAFDTVPRKMAMSTLRWMGSPESEVKMVEAMYENTTGRVVVGSGMSNEFQVNIGLRQGSALSPLLFILVMELISRKIGTTYAMKKIMYADDLVIVAEHREELQGALEEWNEMFKKHGLKMNLDKTEVFFYRISSSHIFNSVCWSHALVNGPTSKSPASDGGRCSGQLLMMWSAVCSGSPHSHVARSASPHFFVEALYRPTSVRSLFRVVQCFRLSSSPLTPSPGSDTWQK